LNELRAAAAAGLLALSRVRGTVRAPWGWEGARGIAASSPRRRGARVFVLAVAALLLATSCASALSFPYPSCLYDQQGRYDAGKVIAAREDGARLFQFNDTSKGDHGFRWVIDGEGRTLRPCREATLMDAAQSAPRTTTDPEEQHR
jgi:hypothetical protein